MTITVPKWFVYSSLVVLLAVIIFGGGYYVWQKQNINTDINSTPTAAPTKTQAPISADYQCKAILTAVAKGANQDHTASECLSLKKWYRNYGLQYDWDSTYGDKILEVYTQLGERGNGNYYSEDALVLVIVNDPSKSIVVTNNVDISTVLLTNNQRASLMIGSRSFSLYTDPNYVAPAPVPETSEIEPVYEYESPSCTMQTIQSYNPEYDSFDCEFYRFFDQDRYANTFSKREECMNPLIEEVRCVP